jgi:diadenosine tetraphosphate (Ap4A) HIT family hydrolase
MTKAHPSFDSACGVCRSLSGDEAQRPLYEDDLWHVRHLGSPHGLPGWMLLIAKRHVGGPAHFDDAETESFGPVLRHLEKKLEEVTGALRIYTAALGESSPHFHCHMLPRYKDMPNGVKAWGAFDLERAARAGEVKVDVAEVERISEAYRAALAASPPPHAVGRSR